MDAKLDFLIRQLNLTTTADISVNDDLDIITVVCGRSNASVLNRSNGQWSCSGLGYPSHTEYSPIVFRQRAIVAHCVAEILSLNDPTISLAIDPEVKEFMQNYFDKISA